VSGELKFADAAPTPKKMRAYRALAKLQTIDPAKGEDHLQELWNIVMRFAVLDETMRWPNLELPSARGVEAKFETLMRHVQKLALTVLVEQGYVDDPTQPTAEEPKVQIIEEKAEKLVRAN
jgi:hypothetical protein